MVLLGSIFGGFSSGGGVGDRAFVFSFFCSNCCARRPLPIIRGGAVTFWPTDWVAWPFVVSAGLFTPPGTGGGSDVVEEMPF